MTPASLAAALAVAQVAQFPVPSLVLSHYFVTNNTSQALRCRYRVGEGAWSAYFRLGPGAEFHRGETGFRPVYFFCNPPVERATYRLAPGQRYSLLRAADRTIALREITASGSSGNLPGS
jgi:hypothetical protein